MVQKLQRDKKPSNSVESKKINLGIGWVFYGYNFGEKWGKGDTIYTSYCDLFNSVWQFHDWTPIVAVSHNLFKPCSCDPDVQCQTLVNGWGTSCHPDGPPGVRGPPDLYGGQVSPDGAPKRPPESSSTEDPNDSLICINICIGLLS